MKRKLKKNVKRKLLASIPILALTLGVGIAALDNIYGNSDPVTYTSESNYYDPSDPDMDLDGDGEAESPEEVFPRNEYSGYWTLTSNDTWVYTFYVTDDKAEYYVYEDEVYGFTGDATIETPGTTVDGAATITNTSDEEKEYGSLTVSKTLYSNGSEVVEEKRTFTVKVTLTAADGSALTGTKTYSGTDYAGNSTSFAFSNGVATITLENNSSFTINNIPAGYLYTIEETNASSYEVTYENQSGTIIKDTTAAVTISNTTTTTEESKTGNIWLEKEVTGYADLVSAHVDDEYTFRIALSDLGFNKTYTSSTSR